MTKAELEARLSELALTKTDETEEATTMMTDTMKEAEAASDMYEELGIYASDEERQLSELCQRANEVSRSETKEEILKKLKEWDKDTAIDVCYMLLHETRGQMPECDMEVYADMIWEKLTESNSNEVSIEAQMPKIEA